LISFSNISSKTLDTPYVDVLPLRPKKYLGKGIFLCLYFFMEEKYIPKLEENQQNFPFLSGIGEYIR